jgi:regulatory protein
LVQTRRQRGYGPLRIQKEMRDKSVDGELIQRSLDAGDPQWVELSKQVRRKRFGDKLPSNYAERAKQARFLQYRGFTFDQIRCVFDVNDLE